MTLPDEILADVAALAAAASVTRRDLRPVALALVAEALLAGALAFPPPPALAWLSRALYVAWPAPAAALALHAYGRRGSWLLAALGFPLVGLALAVFRELPAVAALPEGTRAGLFLLAYRASRLAGLGVALAVVRRPRTPAQRIAAVLAASGVWDLIGWYFGDPWTSWAGARVLACTTWVVVAVLLVWPTDSPSRTPSRRSGSPDRRVARVALSRAASSGSTRSTPTGGHARSLTPSG